LAAGDWRVLQRPKVLRGRADKAEVPAPATLAAVDSRDRAYIARQPILDVHGRVFGYELLYRASGGAAHCEELHGRAAARVLNDALITIGLETLANNSRAFINFTQEMLVTELATLLPPSKVVVEVLEGEEIGVDAVVASKQLKERGYVLALDDFTPGTSADALLPYVSFVKVDVLSTSPEEREEIRRIVPANVTLLAEKVESAEMFEDMRARGYQLFQGYYFCRPVTLSGEALSTRHLAYTRLLAALNSPHVSVASVEDLVKHDAALSYRVLRCVNSAGFGIRREITSIRQALVLMGLDRIRKWASVWAMAGLSQGSNPELVTTAVLRARSCEMLGSDVSGGSDASEFFLLGLCSLIDVMLGRPMDQVMAELPLSDSVRTALTSGQNVERAVLDAVVAYERGDWTDASRLGSLAGLAPDRLPSAYSDALQWAREISTVIAA
jgi:EAL and modified HD-GYP domain-containing signal transduction protein